VAPPNRTARVAVLGSSVQRSNSDRFPSRARGAVVRRAVLAVLVLVALALLTISFRSPTSGALHDVQGYGAAALRPFQVAAERVARPFRDVYGYFSGLADAKSENAKLRRDVRKWRAQANANLAAARRASSLEGLLRFEQGSSYPKDYRPVNAAVISFPSGPAVESVTIAAGSTNGIRNGAPVVNEDGLIGHVTNVALYTSVVTLLNDPDSYVTARDVSTGVSGLVRRGVGGSLLLDDVAKEKKVTKGDIVVTNGTVDRRYPDLYPYGIPIGVVQSVGTSDIANFLTVQVTPYAQLDSLDAVAVLVPTKRSARP
jgi:rod shape-determining protein MreC